MIYDIMGNQLGEAPFGYGWSGRKIAVLGESHVDYAAAKFYEFLEEQLGVQVYRLGISGQAVAPPAPGKDHDFRRRVSDVPADVDLIYIMGDTNAMGRTEEFGTTDTDHLDSTDITTWGGRWNVMVDAFKRAFPTVPIILVSDYPHKDAEKRTMDAYIQLNHLAIKYGCFFLAAGRDGGFSRTYTSKVWGGDDTGHCNEDATRAWVYTVVQKIHGIRPPVWAGADTLSIDSTASVSVGGTASIGHNITGDQSIQWTSSNEGVACVMGGVVYGMTAGTATITAKTHNGNTARCTVTVT